MCGIAGVYNRQNPVTRETLIHMGEALKHRGPDGHGLFLNESIGLVHQRLAIVDVEGGAQPFSTEEERHMTLVANGEIYNHLRLRKELISEGQIFKSKSDCEVILHLYAKRGLEALTDLEGMYAFALVDNTNQTMILARDPFGIKPLYYMETEHGFAFASEPRSLLTLGWITPKLRKTALPHLLAAHFTPADETLFEDIHRVLPGETLIITHGRIVERRHVPLPFKFTQNRSNPTEFQGELFQAVERHLATEVPMGLFLSGGLDSTALLQSLAEQGLQVQTYTARFENTSAHDETSTAATLAATYNMPHSIVAYTEEDFWHDLVEMAWSMDDLVADYAILPSLKLARVAQADGIKVVFSGEGGDEMLAGYRRFRYGLLRRWLKKDALHGKHGWTKIKPYLQEMKHSLKLPPTRVNLKNMTRLQKMQFQSLQGLQNDLLPKLDRSLMRYGLEGRVPYLDDKFASYTFCLPDNQKTSGKYGKWILRNHLAKKDIPSAWCRKHGFSVPVGEWMAHQRSALKHVWDESPLLQSILRPQATNDLLERLPKRDVSEQVFSLTVVALWHAIHIEGKSKDDIHHMFQKHLSV